LRERIDLRIDRIEARQCQIEQRVGAHFFARNKRRQAKRVVRHIFVKPHARSPSFVRA
jgi:hypothetical protein